jgi:hypothetical protein
MNAVLSSPAALLNVPALRMPKVLRVVHSIRRDTAQRTYDQRRTRLPKELYNHQLSAWERDYLNWYHGDPLKRSFSMARKRSQDNRTEVYASDLCGCFHCGATYAARAVEQWYSSPQEATALCPECGIDARRCERLPAHECFPGRHAAAVVRGGVRPISVPERRTPGFFVYGVGCKR